MNVKMKGVFSSIFFRFFLPSLCCMGVDCSNISYALLSHNETDCLRDVLKVIGDNKDARDEVIVVDDYSSNFETLQILREAHNNYGVIWVQHALNFDFAQQRNYLQSLCKGNYIFSLDPDESPSSFLIKHIREIISSGADGYGVAEGHIVANLPSDFPHKPDEKGRLYWPSYHVRITKNAPTIFWVNRVHERIVGCSIVENLPATEKYAIFEYKDYKKWSNSHLFYNECYRRWLLDAIKLRDSALVCKLIAASRFAHLNYFKSVEFMQAMASAGAVIDSGFVEELSNFFGAREEVERDKYFKQCLDWITLHLNKKGR